jgi:UDP-N-acetylmuramate dehydrogenase
MSFDNKFMEWFKDNFGDDVRFNCPMSEYTRFKVGGEAYAVVSVKYVKEAKKVIKFCLNNRIKYLVMGKGTNILVKDNGFSGIVLQFLDKSGRILIKEQNSKCVKIAVTSGTTMAAVCSFAIKNGFLGFNFALGIPGTMGGGIMMNAGSDIGSMEDIVDSVDVLTPSGQYKTLNRGYLDFSYRKLKLIHIGLGLPTDNKHIIASCIISLVPSDKKVVKEEARLTIKKRKANQPKEFCSAGCFFKNPENSEYFAGQLIELCGLKGKAVGGAAVSEKHANFIINKNSATANDIINLKKIIQKEVYSKYKIFLEPEVIIV